MKKPTEKYFPVLLRWEVVIKKISNEDAGILLKSMFKYYMTRKQPDFSNSQALDIFWCDVQNWLDTSKEHYEKKIQQTSEAGKASADKRKQVTDVNERQQTLTKAIATSISKEDTKAISASNETTSADATLVGDDGDSDNFEEDKKTIERVISYFKEHIKSELTIQDTNTLVELCERYNEMAIRCAIDRSAKRGGKSANYVKTALEKGIANDYDKAGYTKDNSCVGIDNDEPTSPFGGYYE